MRYVAAYLLATLGGKTSPSEDDVKKILSSVGIEADAAKLSKVMKELSGKDINAIIAEGEKKLASVPSGGAAAAPAAAAAGAPAKKEEKKEEKKKEEKKEEKPPSDDDMGFGLFD